MEPALDWVSCRYCSCTAQHAASQLACLAQLGCAKVLLVVDESPAVLHWLLHACLVLTVDFLPCCPAPRTLRLCPCCPGLAALGTGDEEVFEDLKNVLYMDDAVAGEAAGIGMGLLCCGSGSDKTQEMLAYAHDTQVRCCALSQPGVVIFQSGVQFQAETQLLGQTSSRGGCWHGAPPWLFAAVESFVLPLLACRQFQRRPHIPLPLFC